MEKEEIVLLRGEYRDDLLSLSKSFLEALDKIGFNTDDYGVLFEYSSINIGLSAGDSPHGLDKISNIRTYSNVHVFPDIDGKFCRQDRGFSIASKIVSFEYNRRYLEDHKASMQLSLFIIDNEEEFFNLSRNYLERFQKMFDEFNNKIKTINGGV